MSDLISRQDAIIAIKEHELVNLDENRKWYNHGLLDAEIAILDLPSAELDKNSTKLNSENDELISKQDAVWAVHERIKQIGYENDPKVLSIRQAVREVPSAQPEIIRCKDCKFFELSKDKLASQYKISGCFRLKKLSAEYPLLTDSNGFCSWAERRTDETD